MIAKEGILIGIAPVIIGIIFFLIGLTASGVISIFIGLFVLFFFRQPLRLSAVDDNVVYAPVDGKVIQVKEEFEDCFFKETVNKISIFMNIFNVHITYAPVKGQVTKINYTAGCFKDAGRITDGNKETNENNFIAVNNGGKKIALRQVAGYIARRIVCDVKEGDLITAGDRIGLIKFGSRIDVYLPREWRINVKKGVRTKGGRTVLAEFSK